MRRGALAGAVLLGLGSVPAAALDLEGTWHVTAHYQDAQSHDPQAERWDDRVWVFEQEGESLRWTEYPIVVFDDSSGRFERLSTNRASRVLGYWQPNDAQLAELAGGPKVNPRGSRSKRLRGAPGRDWRSTGSPSPGSASVITFTANWSIERPSELPVFRMEDVLGSALSAQMEGGTLYETEAVEAGGDVLRGRYDRDGTRIGTFVARRTPPPRGLGTKEEQQERIRLKMVRSLGLELARQAQQGSLGEAERQELRAGIARSVEERLRAQGREPSQQEVAEITGRIEALVLEGAEPEVIERALREAGVGP